jgi:hypothetical protein
MKDDLKTRCIQSGSLSAEGSYALYVTGRWSAREAIHLIRQLELQCQWLIEDGEALTGREKKTKLDEDDGDHRFVGGEYY